MARPAFQRDNILTPEERAKRVLMVLYALSQGMPGIQVQTSALLAECARLKLFQMSEAEFNQYHTTVLLKFKKNSPN